jgi:Arc/MetJ family transcription regulator
MMRTTLNIDEALLEEVICLTGESDKGKAVNEALAEFVRRHKLEELRSLRGKINILDNLDEMRELELKKMRESGW